LACPLAIASSRPSSAHFVKTSIGDFILTY
jgi:hypothetical protein